MGESTRGRGHLVSRERPFSPGAALGGFLCVQLSSHLPGLLLCVGDLSDKASQVRQGNCICKGLES